MKILKGELKTLNNTDYANLADKTDQARLNLQQVQRNLLLQNGNEVLKDQEILALGNLIRLSRAEESFTKQKARLRWIKEGDGSTKFFHHSMKARVNRNKDIYLTLENGNRIHEPKDIHDAAVDHFSKLFTEDSPITYTAIPLNEFVFKSISSDQALDPIQNVTPEEIKRVVFRMKADKAPGPDGFSADFFQRSWHIVGEEVTRTVMSFFKYGKLLKEVNHTSLTLIPKISNPSKLSDFRPIACCNFLYKCISGIIANRLKVLLPSFIDEAQAAFIPGRSMSNNIFLAQELFRNYHRAATGARCAIKVDLIKGV